MSNNKSRGSNLEREIVNDLKKVGFEKAATSRYASRMLDDNKVDVAFSEPFAFQIKTLNGRAKYEEILSEMITDDLKVLIHKMTRKANKSFMEVGKFAILDYYDFLNILVALKSNNLEIKKIF